jgi:Trk K+ transport system NAD-binding subunit
MIERLARIAPVTVLDASPAALEQSSTRSLQSAGGSHTIVRQVGDGTSRLVLEDLRGDLHASVGLVVAPGDDRAALEVCRLGTELGFAPVIAIVNDRDHAQRCEKFGARALVRAEIVGQLVEQSLSLMGVGVTRAAGSGRGELLEFTVQASSPAIGVPLADLRADGWRVAAIYRSAELVLPTGMTTIEADDRVLVVGDPDQLPHVAESLRIGVPTFPLLHGPNVVAYMPSGRDGNVETEAELLVARTRAVRLVRVYPHAQEAQGVIEKPLPNGATTRKRVDDVAIDGHVIDRHLDMLRAKQPGVVVARVGPRSALDVLLGRGGSAATLCNDVSSPVLFSRGAPRHDRVVLCLTDGEVDLTTCEVALDLARMFAIPLQVLRVQLPAYLQPADVATDQLLETFMRRARLHGLVPEIQRREGNPIAEWTRTSGSTDLAVVPRRRSLRDSFSKPDLALRLARKARGSVLVVTRAERPFAGIPSPTASMT